MSILTWIVGILIIFLAVLLWSLCAISGLADEKMREMHKEAEEAYQNGLQD